jgi:hypothetical protein
MLVLMGFFSDISDMFREGNWAIRLGMIIIALAIVCFLMIIVLHFMGADSDKVILFTDELPILGLGGAMGGTIIGFGIVFAGIFLSGPTPVPKPTEQPATVEQQATV